MVWRGRPSSMASRTASSSAICAAAASVSRDRRRDAVGVERLGRVVCRGAGQRVGRIVRRSRCSCPGCRGARRSTRARPRRRRRRTARTCCGRPSSSGGSGARLPPRGRGARGCARRRPGFSVRSRPSGPRPRSGRRRSPCRRRSRRRRWRSRGPGGGAAGPAIEGTTVSGVMVANTDEVDLARVEASLGEARPRPSPAPRGAACSARSAFDSPTATCLLSIPVRVLIHSSFVSTSAFRSSFCTSSAGTALPNPTNALPTMFLLPSTKMRLPHLTANGLPRKSRRILR